MNYLKLYSWKLCFILNIPFDPKNCWCLLCRNLYWTVYCGVHYRKVCCLSILHYCRLKKIYAQVLQEFSFSNLSISSRKFKMFVFLTAIMRNNTTLMSTLTLTMRKIHECLFIDENMCVCSKSWKRKMNIGSGEKSAKIW